MKNIKHKNRHLTILLYFILCIAIAQKKSPSNLNDVKEQMMIHFLTSNEAIDQFSDVQEALKHYNKGYELARIINTDSVLAIADLYKAIIYYNRGDYNLAEKTFNKSISVFKSIDKNHILIGKIYNHLGISAHKQKDEPKTEKYFELAYQHFKKLKTFTSSALTPIYNLAVLYFDRGKYELSKERMEYVERNYYNLIKEKRDISIIHEDITHKKTLLHIALCEINLGNIQKVKYKVSSIIKLFKEKKSYKLISNYFKDLRDYNMRKGDFKKANSLSDSVLKYVNLHHKRWREKNKNYIKNSKTLENSVLKQNLAQKNEQLAHQKVKTLTWILIIASALILSLFTISMLLKQKNKILKLLKTKAEQDLIQNTKFITSINNELKMPLTFLLKSSQQLLDDNPNKNQKKHINTIVTIVNQLQNLINNTLNTNKTNIKK